MDDRPDDGFREIAVSDHSHLGRLSVAGVVDQLILPMLMSLRIAPTLAYAPPFTLLRIPVVVRVALAIGVAAWIPAAFPSSIGTEILGHQNVVLLAASELFLGIALALALQIGFAMMATMARVVDIQAGFGLSVLVDPTTRAQSPLIGMILAYSTGAIFFMSGGPADLLAVLAHSFILVPLGDVQAPGSLGSVLALISGTSFISLGVAGILILTLFLIDLSIALISRTLPQMNVLLLGFQVKALATLAVLPLAMGLSVAGSLQLIRFSLSSALQLVA